MVFHLTGMLGRLSSTVALRRYGDRRVITVAGMLSVVGMLLALSTSDAPLAVSVLLLVGLGQSPIAPTACSLAAQAGAHHGVHAVSIAITCGYTSLLISNLLVGALASFFLRRLSAQFSE